MRTSKLGPLRRATKPGAEVPGSRAPDQRDVPTGPLFLPQFCGPPTHRIIEPVQQVEPGGKQGVAPKMRSHRCFFSVFSPSPHGRKNSPRWFRSSCQPGTGPGVQPMAWRSTRDCRCRSAAGLSAATHVFLSAAENAMTTFGGHFGDRGRRCGCEFSVPLWPARSW
jgi:hypothetical protein